MYSVHDLTSMSMKEAYDATQYCRHIEDGDVLIVEDGLAVMMKAWPTMIEGESNVFHLFINESEYHEYHAQANEILTNPDALRARAVNTVAEIREEERAEQADWDQRQQNLMDDA